MAAWRRGIAAVLGCLAVGAAVAQVQVELGPSEAVQCLTPAAAQRSAVEFPFDQWKFGRDGDVRVELTFTGPDLAPAVAVVSQQGDDEFVQAVRRHVAGWRVPCMAPGAAPVRLVQEFAFRSAMKQALVLPPRDAADELRRKLLDCMRHVSGAKHPAYPRQALLSAIEGRVVVRLAFRDPALPPQAQVFARDAAWVLRSEVEDFVPGYRVPCLSGEAVVADIVFIYRIEGNPAYGFKPLQLLDLLRMSEGISRRALKLDTTAMRCPFELRFTYRRPHLPNGVFVLGEPVVERHPLLALLGDLQLDLPRKSLDSVFGDTTLVTVPCLRIDLKPQGETQ